MSRRRVRLGLRRSERAERSRMRFAAGAKRQPVPRGIVRVSALLFVPLQRKTPRVLFNTLQGLCFNLTDTLSGHAKFFPHFFQSMSNAINQAESHFKDPSFSWSQVDQDSFNPFFQECPICVLIGA